VSAIAGLFLFDGEPVERSILNRMAASLAHRGDGPAGCWTEGSVGLTGRLRATTPESRLENFPLPSRRREFVIVADARLDNRGELFSALKEPNDIRVAVTDGCLILRAYKRWGEDCPEKLLGDFAFAIWDVHRRTLFCARDPIGVRPFYYHRSSRLFAFASEIKALLSLDGVPRRLNEARVCEYRFATCEEKSSTFYEEILRLPPGHSMAVGPRGSAPRAYWRLDPDREVRLGSDEAYAEAFGAIFRDAVRCRLRSAGPVGSLLSGGLDSSSIVCVAREILGADGREPLHTFSAVFPEVPRCDESEFIDSVVTGGGCRPHYVRGDRLSPLGELDRMLWHADGPFFGPNLYLHWELYRAAARQGIRVLLDGIDGDTTVSHGLLRLAEIARHGSWIELLSEVYRLSRRTRTSPWRLLWRYCLRPLAPEPLRRAWRARRGGPETFRPVLDSREEHFRRMDSALITHVLELTDHAAAAFGIEPRYPFFDRRLVEFCLALPGEQKLRRGWTRYVLRRALAGSVPRRIARRGDKANLAENFRRGLLYIDGRRVEEVIASGGGGGAGTLSAAALRKSYRRMASSGAGGSRAAVEIWRALVLEEWLRTTDMGPSAQARRSSGLVEARG